jgi:hypothetical protein
VWQRRGGVGRDQLGGGRAANLYCTVIVERLKRIQQL